MLETGKQPGEQQGFTLVEALMAILICSGGLLVLASAFAQGMIIISSSHLHQIGKEKASEAIESIFTARDSLQLDWSKIKNTSDGGIFETGEQDIREAGADGLVNTADDGDIESAIMPDGRVFSLAQFKRQIEIVDVVGVSGGMLRQVTVTVSYPIGSITRQYSVTTYISAYA
jgi:hypothetical protein